MQTIVFHQGALGDSVLIWPLLRAMGDVVLVAPWGKAKLAERWLPHVKAVDGESPDFARLFVPGAQCEAADSIIGLLQSAERVVSFISNGRDAWAQNIIAIGGTGKACFVPHRPPQDHVEHVTHFHARLLVEQSVHLAPLQSPVRRNTDGPVVIQPGSGGRSKCWPAERFDALIEHFHAVGRPVQVVLGEAEREYLDARWPARWRRKCELLEPAGYIELSLVLSRAAVFIGNDSGPTHLAAQLGVPTVVLFGPSNPYVWAPQGPAVRVLHPPQPTPMDWLNVEPVIEAVAAMS